MAFQPIQIEPNWQDNKPRRSEKKKTVRYWPPGKDRQDSMAPDEVCNWMDFWAFKTRTTR